MNWRCAPSAEVLHRHLDHARLGGIPIFASSQGGGVSCHEPTGPCVARSVVALAEQ